MATEQSISQRVVVVPAPSQVLRLEPVVAQVLGGGTSAVVLRGDEYWGGGVRVALEADDTASSPYGQSGSSTGLTSS